MFLLLSTIKINVILKKKEDLMRVIGIICEYNPFHLGHLYQIKQIPHLPISINWILLDVKKELSLCESITE